jgi:hypothetical protein
MYSAEGDKVYVKQDGEKQHFLTVHPTDTGGTVTIEEQARMIAKLLNDL